MSADYDRLFQSPSDADQADERTVHVDRDAILSVSCGTDADRRSGAATKRPRRRCPSHRRELRPRRLRRRGSLKSPPRYRPLLPVGRSAKRTG